MEYNPSIYIASSSNICRYALGVEGNNPLIVIGVNPSTADDKIPDRTMTKVMNHARILGFDGFIMFNLYPQRATCPDDLQEKPNMKFIEKNTEVIKLVFRKYAGKTILAAWGQTIMMRPYLIDCLKEIEDILSPFEPKWGHLGTLTLNGHPRHPSRTSYACRLIEFNIHRYIKKLSIGSLSELN
ncbi:MAG: DUF1643 domain-containing protein [Bacteroidia bacterium]|nr:DUF1643 domain-containing protein [Bacteroidia bacterium]